MSMKFTPELDGAAQHADAFVAVGGRAPDALTGDAHGAEAEAVDGQIAAEGERSGCLGNGLCAVTSTTVRRADAAAHLAWQAEHVDLSSARGASADLPGSGRDRGRSSCPPDITIATRRASDRHGPSNVSSRRPTRSCAGACSADAGLRVEASTEVAVVDAVVMVRLGPLPAPCRVVYVIDEPDIRRVRLRHAAGPCGVRRGTLRRALRPGHRRGVRRGVGVLPARDVVEQSRRPGGAGGPARHRPALPARGVTRYQPQPVNNFSAPAHICSMTSPTDASSRIMPTD